MENAVGHQIKKIRSKHKLSQRRFGYKIGLTGKTISAYETGKCTPTLKVLDKIAQTYEVAITHTPKNYVAEKIDQLEYQLKELRGLILTLG